MSARNRRAWERPPPDRCCIAFTRSCWTVTMCSSRCIKSLKFRLFSVMKACMSVEEKRSCKFRSSRTRFCTEDREMSAMDNRLLTKCRRSGLPGGRRQMCIRDYVYNTERFLLNRHLALPLESLMRYRGFKILVRHRVSRCRVFKGLPSILVKNQKELV